MPIVEQSDINWAKEIDEKDTEVEFNEENGFKTKIEYKNEDGKKFKITSIFRLEKVKVPKTVAERKNWSKFGDAANDPPGVNSATTVVSDEVFMQFLTKTEEVDKNEPSATVIPSIKCRYCKGDHWSAKCPLKDILQDKINESNAKDAASSVPSSGSTNQAYKPPSMRAGASGKFDPSKKFDSKAGFNNKDDYTIRVTNLPEEATESDLMELFKPFGKVNRTFLAKDKNTQVSRGFAFVNFQNKDDAQRAIWGVNDYGYNHLILKVEWAKPSKDSN